MRKTNEQSFGEIFREMLKVYRLDASYRQTEVLAALEEVVGKVVHSRISKAYLRGKVLVIRFSSAVLKEEYSFARTRLVEMINDRVGYDAIDSIDIG
jgi:hypothetical protein